MEKNVFEQMASRYDTTDRIELANIILQEVRPDLANSKTKSLLDYGSGTGLIGLGLTDLVESVLLVDSSKQMLEVAEAKVEQKGITNASIWKADFVQEKPSGIKADIILMSLVLLHIPETEKILQTLYSILNPGGKLIIIDFDKNENISHPKVHNGFEHEELKKRLANVGFTATEIETFHHGENLFMKQDASMFKSVSTKL